MRPPILVNETMSPGQLVLGDVMVFRTAEALTSYLEAWYEDETYEAFDADGRELELYASGDALLVREKPGGETRLAYLKELLDRDVTRLNAMYLERGKDRMVAYFEDDIDRTLDGLAEFG